MPEQTKDIHGFTSHESALAPKGENYLLAIGIDTYSHFTPLHNAVKDIDDISRLLIDDYGFSKEAPYFNALKNEQASRKNIIKQLKQLCRQVKPTDRVLIYYSGHGYLDPLTEVGYWIPIDAEKDNEAAYVPNSTIRDYIKAMKSRHTLLISDSCFSGSLLVRDANREIDGAFSDWEAKKSRWLFCSGKGVVSDGKRGTNSPFAQQIIQHLSNPKKDKINIARLADEVTTSVRFNYEQQAEASPFYQVGHAGGQFIFYRKADQASKEEAAFQQAKSSTDSAVLRQFLASSTNREHKRVIRNVLKELEHNEIWQQVNKRSYAELDEFVDDYPNHPMVEEAKRFMAELLSKPKSKPTSKVKKKSSPKVIHPTPQIKKDPDIFVDTRDGQQYKTKVMKDGKRWMIQNLNFEVADSWWFDDKKPNGDKYGRLYTWEAAKKACPPGWHVPSDTEWQAMAKHYGGSIAEANDGGKATYKALIEGGSSGFSALLGGSRRSGGSYSLGEWGFYWSSTEGSSDSAWRYYFGKPHTHSGLSRHGYDKAVGLSCRCVQGEQPKPIKKNDDKKSKKSTGKIINPTQHIIKTAEIDDKEILTDTRDGQQYKTKVMKDGKRWMVQNLNFEIEDSWWYDDKKSNGDNYGRLYTWEAAQKACPLGWHVPSDTEWQAMAKHYGGCYGDASDGGKAAYKALIGGGSGGFSALLGGYRRSDGSYYNLGKYGNYWSSTEKSSSGAWVYSFLKSSSKLSRYNGTKTVGRSCRCIQD